MPSKATLKDIQLILKGTKLESLSKAYLNAEKIYKVNSIFLISLSAQESGYGTSRRSVEQNNITGFTVYGDYAKGTTFNSKSECILETAKLLSEDYLNPKGKFYNGKSIWDINSNYCQDTGFYWANSINSIANTLVKKINK